MRHLQDNPVVEKPTIGVDNEAYTEDEEPEKIIGEAIPFGLFLIVF